MAATGHQPSALICGHKGRGGPVLWTPSREPVVINCVMSGGGLLKGGEGGSLPRAHHQESTSQGSKLARKATVGVNLKRGIGSLESSRTKQAGNPK